MNPTHSPPVKTPPPAVVAHHRKRCLKCNRKTIIIPVTFRHRNYTTKSSMRTREVFHLAKTYLIQTLLRGRRIPLEIIFLIRQFILLRIDETKEFGEDGKPTGRIIGYTLTCVEMTNYERFTVKVSTLNIPITNDKLQAIREDGDKVLIEFDNATIMPYINERNNALMDSIKADGFRIVSDKEVNLL